VPVLLINVGVHVIQLFKPRWLDVFCGVGIFGVLLAIALLVMAVLARLFALGVQDRVIRLEERIRCERLLPEDLKSRIGELTTIQMVGLRFASDAELPALARKVLDGKVNDRKAIKQMVQNWRADYQRI
jgi:hypothetical protein